MHTCPIRAHGKTEECQDDDQGKAAELGGNPPSLFLLCPLVLLALLCSFFGLSSDRFSFEKVF